MDKSQKKPLPANCGSGDYREHRVFYTLDCIPVLESRERERERQADRQREKC